MFEAIMTLLIKSLLANVSKHELSGSIHTLKHIKTGTFNAYSFSEYILLNMVYHVKKLAQAVFLA